MRHRPELDGLRGLAIALVLMHHADIPFHGFGGGLVGVTLFFVLSGYLITKLLVAERERTGRLDLRNFYLRRVVRLGPALVLVGAFVVLAGVTSRSEGAWAPGIVTAFTYTTNWANLLDVPTGLMAHTWSLSIEEQFYAIWPIVLLITVRSRWIALVGAVIGTALYGVPMQGAYFSSITNGGALLAGCAVALWGARLPRSFVGLGLGSVAVASIEGSQPMAVAGAVMIICSSSLVLTPLASVGRRGYGLYLWNYPLTLLFGPLVGLVGTFAAAEASYRIVERPILQRFHERLRPRDRSERIESETPFSGRRILVGHPDQRAGAGVQRPE